MQAVILTGGRGVRIRPITDRIPKGLVEVAGRPFLEYIFLYLKRFGIRNILLCTGYLGEKIRERFRDGSEYGIQVRYSQEEELLDTGGALKKALPLLEEEFFLVNGDTLLPSDYGRMEEAFANSTGLVMLSAFPVRGIDLVPNLYVEEKGRVAGYCRSSPDKNFAHVDAGVSIFRRGVGDYFPGRNKFSLEEEVYPRLIEAGQVEAWLVDQQFYDIGTPEGLKKFESFLGKYGKEFFE